MPGFGLSRRFNCDIGGMPSPEALTKTA